MIRKLFVYVILISPSMGEKEQKRSFAELQNLSDWERGKFCGAVFVHSILCDKRLAKSFILETFENTANGLATTINFSKFVNAFYLELLDAIEFLKQGDDLEELKKKIEEKIGIEGGGEKRFL